MLQTPGDAQRGQLNPFFHWEPHWAGSARKELTLPPQPWPPGPAAQHGQEGPEELGTNTLYQALGNSGSIDQDWFFIFYDCYYFCQF